MSAPVRMPQLGESAIEGTILRWLKQPGDSVARDEPLVEVMTDKVTVEIPSPVAGVLVRQWAAVGETVPVGAPLAEISHGPAETPTPWYSPAVRKLAREHGIDLRTLRGSGAGGRVTRQDVLALVAHQAATSTDEEVVPLSPLRRQLAERLSRLVREVPLAWTLQEVDVTGLVALREATKAAFRERFGIPLTYLPFVLRAACEALAEVPIVNSRWEGDRIVRSRRVHLGVAVALEEGLIVPVIRDADQLTLAELAQAAFQRAEQARAGTLRPEDVSGGTFTVNNTGAFGSLLSFPLPTPGQAAILTLEAITRRPVVLADGSIAPRARVNLCLTFDHRIFDGATAGQFLDAVRRRLEAYRPTTPLGGEPDASTS
ncbi:MAG: 2-oxo acid dehydrogenase subunit E2 [Chloroflexi bacterium]|nr:2-oxo acid dehydrogenase subunit E2 [Chloroflexota bacterium]